jgi:uncharacterized membrane protein YdjX (TVP38/TMEM64 family)
MPSFPVMRQNANTKSRRMRDPGWWRRVGLLGVGVLALIVVATSDTLFAALTSLNAFAAPLMRERPVVGAVVFVLVSALSAVLAFFSSAVLVPVAVQVWGVSTAMALLWIGWIIGGASAYALAVWAGRPIVARLVSAESLERYGDRFTVSAPFSLVLLFQLGMPSEVPGYLLGLIRYPVWRYLAALALAELPWAVITVFLGTSLLARRVNVLVLLGVGAGLASALAFWLLHRRLRRGAEDNV